MSVILLIMKNAAKTIAEKPAKTSIPKGVNKTFKNPFMKRFIIIAIKNGMKTRI